ncbi:PEBP-like protein [Dendrothele bispora CBS 962.96]|uniref:PEBP-like protein n=1 Tax=Dendrothele bispora (strain CBS 962.96) TaxID=1314807 RepID=A0A4S8L600_DENBC|nr:PEBP-like protein [Dendrothele bispora CBS 962.96]
MRLSNVAFVLSLLSCVYGQDSSLSDVKSAFDEANIPADIGINFDPTVLLEVAFPQPDGSVITLKAGVQLPRNATAGPPVFSVSSDTADAAGPGPFVVAAVDPDAPTPQQPTSAQIRHFLGSDFTQEADGALVNSTAAISGFRQPTPPAGSDAHRYIFLLFNQPEGFDDQTLVNSSSPVDHFDIAAFADATGLGDPIGGTFMLVAPDPTTA